MTKVLNTRTPNPGSEEAINAGCTCPVMDNAYGKGYHDDGKTFVYNMNCKIHSSGMWIDKNGLNIK